ncbi:MAG: hypothetical protein R3E79_24185 [Caldilineaceae bacterium]
MGRIRLRRIWWAVSAWRRISGGFAAGEPVLITAVSHQPGARPKHHLSGLTCSSIQAWPGAVNAIWSSLQALPLLRGCLGCGRGLRPRSEQPLTSTGDSYSAGHTIWPGYFASGTTDLYLYVDRWNPGVATGAAAESDETNNRAELHGLQVTGPNPTSVFQRRADELPPRPAQP